MYRFAFCVFCTTYRTVSFSRPFTTMNHIDVISLLEADHKEVREVFAAFALTNPAADEDTETKKHLVDKKRERGGKAADGIKLLKSDHTELRGVFDAFKVIRNKEGKEGEKKELVDQMVKLLKVHTDIEDRVFYSETRELVPKLESTILECYEEHHVADTLCTELSSMSPTDENFVAKTMVLIDCVTRHMDDEEQDWFPQVRKSLTDEQLQDIGTRMEELKAKH